MGKSVLQLEMIPHFYPRKLPKAILFDWDNTLVDTWRVAYDSINVAREALGLSPLTLHEFWSQPHLSLRDASRDLFGDAFERGEKLFYDAVKKFHLQDLATLEGAEPLLHTLKELGIYTGVVSNKDGTLLRKEVHHLGWSDHFHQVVGSRDAEQDKPSHLPVLAALEKSTVVPSHDVWFVGDSIVDVHCARASGCVPIVVGHGDASQEEDIIHAKNCTGLARILSSL